MVKTTSTMLPLGTIATHFSLPNIDGKPVSLDDFKSSKGFVVVFMCNHCPFVKHLRAGLAKFGEDYQVKGVAVVGISSNDVSVHPDDSPARMIDEHKSAGYTFPYLYDATQQVANDYKAACTPDFFVFDSNRSLVYRGQFDSSRPGNGKPVTGIDLRNAVDNMLAGKGPLMEQRPSIGCNIKWIPGKEPGYFTGVSAVE